MVSPLGAPQLAAPNVPPSPAPPKLTVVELAVGGVRAPVHVNCAVIATGTTEP